MALTTMLKIFSEAVDENVGRVEVVVYALTFNSACLSLPATGDKVNFAESVPDRFH